MAYLFPVEDNDIFETVKEFCEKEIKEKTSEWFDKYFPEEY